MSRAFIKEDAGDSDDLPERHQSASPNYVTREGLEALRRREQGLRELLSRLPRESVEAREAARDLRYYAGRVASAILVETPADAGREARFGAWIEMRRGDGRVRRVRVVGQDEAEGSPDDKIAWDSSLAMALIGARPGDRVETEEGLVVVEDVRYA